MGAVEFLFLPFFLFGIRNGKTRSAVQFYCFGGDLYGINEIYDFVMDYSVVICAFRLSTLQTPLALFRPQKGFVSREVMLLRASRFHSPVFPWCSCASSASSIAFSSFSFICSKYIRSGFLLFVPLVLVSFLFRFPAQSLLTDYAAGEWARQKGL